MTNEKAIAELQKYLQDEDYKGILSFCVEPKAWNEIRKLKVKQSKLFQILKDLKVVKALDFANGKYYTTSFAKELLR